MRTKTFNIKWTLGLITILGLLLLTGCSPDKYSAAPLTGHVIDKVTKQPIANAYVVALYGLHGGLNGTYIAPLHYEEAQTDENGHFRFDGFTNIAIDYSRAPKRAVVLDYDPALSFFADGYIPSDAYRDLKSSPSGPHLVSPLDDMTMELKPNTGNIKEDARRTRPYIFGLYGEVSLGYHNGRHLNNKCAILRLPQTLRYIRRTEEKFESTTAYSRQIPLYVYKQCGFQGE